MTLRFDWLHLPHWLGHAHVSRAMSVVLGVIAVSLLFSTLRVIDAAVSGALVGAPLQAPTAARSAMPERPIVHEPAAAGSAVDASLVEVPSATADAISL
jgi:hypothetical protein